MFSVKLINPALSRELIASPYGWRIHPISKRKQFHNGVDIAIPEGTPLYCPLPEARIEWNWHDAGGLQCILFGKFDGLRIRVGFAHCSWVEKEKKFVNKGELVAKSGNTGRSTGAHLHLTIATWSRDGWVYMNPEEVLIWN